MDDLGFSPDMLGLFANNPALLGLFIFGLVATVKRDAERRKPPILWNPWYWRGIAAMFGLLVAFVLHLTTGKAMLLVSGWPGVLCFGLVAATCAVIGRDGLKTMMGWFGGSVSAPIVESAGTVNVNPPASGNDAPAPAPSASAGDVVPTPAGFRPLMAAPAPRLVDGLPVHDGVDGTGAYPAAVLVIDEAPLDRGRP